MAITDATEVNDSSPKPVLTRPEVDMTKRSDALVSTTTADSAALVKDGVLPDTAIIDGPSLSQDAITKDAELLHTAITARSNFNITAAPDVASMERILDPTNKKDREAIEDAYVSLYGTKFRDDLTAYVGSDAVNYRTVEAMLNREDGRTNFGGNLEVAIEATKVDPEKGNRLLRAAVSTLNSDQISQMAFDVQKSYGVAPMDLTPADATEQQKKDFALGLELATTGRKPANEQETEALNTYQKAFVDHVIAQTPGLSDSNREVLAIMTNGSDNRTTAQITEMANIALSANDLRMFADAVGGDTPAAIAARQQLSADTNFASSFKSTFIDNASTTTEQLVAADLLSEGKVSLATIIKGDTNVLMGLWDNPENLDLAASNSTDKERTEFSAGKQISLSGRQPANAEEAAALAYYDKINEAMLSVNMDPKQRARVEDEIQHGGKTLISDLVAVHNDGFIGIGAGQTNQALLSTIEDMSQADYELLHNDPTYLDDVMKGLYSIGTNEDLIPRLTKMLQDKAGAATFEDSQDIKRTVAEVYQDTQTGGATQENLASAIASMSPADAAEYKNNPTYRQQVDDMVNGNDDPIFKFLTTSVLAEVAQTGTSPVLTPLQQIAKGVMDESTQLQQLPLVENVLKDPELRARLSKPNEELSDEDRTTKMILASALQTYINMDQIISEGRVPLGSKLAMGVPFDQLYTDMATLPADQRAMIENQLNDEQKQILGFVVAQNGEERLEDRIRAMVVGGGSYQDVQAELEKLTSNDQKAALIKAYQDKYNSNLSNDFMPLVDSAHKVQFQNYLAPNSDGNQTYFDHVVSTDGQISNAADASPLVPQRAEDMERDLLTQYQALKAQLPVEVQQQLSQLISTAVAQNQAAPMQEIMKLGKVAVDIVAVASILATLGTDTPFAIGASGAAEFMGGTELAVAGADAAFVGTDLAIVDLAATTGTRGIIDGVFTELPEQLLLAAPKAPAVFESAAAPAALESVAAPAALESAVTPTALESVVAPAADLTSAVEQTSAIIARKPTAFVIESTESAEVASVAPRAPFAVDLSEASVQEAANGDLIITKLTPTEVSVEAEAVEPAMMSTAESSPANVIVVDSKGVAIPEAASSDALAVESNAIVAPEAASDALVVESNGALVPEATSSDALVVESNGALVPEAASSDALVVESKLATTPESVEALAVDSSTVAENARLAAPIAQDATAIDAIASNSIVPTLTAAAATTIVANEVLDTEEVQQPVENTTDFTPPTVPNDAIIDLATVRKGEGPFMSAERILAAANDGKRPDITEVKELTAVLKKFFSPERNGNKGMDGLKVKYQFITPENFGDIIAEVSDPDVKAALMQFAAAA